MLYKQGQKRTWNNWTTADEDKEDSVYLYHDFPEKYTKWEVCGSPTYFLLTGFQYEIGFDLINGMAQEVCNEIQILSSLCFLF
jgi:hypothetical protein